MTAAEPVGELDARFSTEGTSALPWEEARGRLEEAKLYWLSTVRPDGRPHVTPLLGVWMDDAMWFCTGPDERKARNLAANPNCVLTTGSNDLDEGLDVVVEGQAVRVEDEAVLQRVADRYEANFGPTWHFEVRDGAFYSEPGAALVYRVAPVTVFGFGKGEYTQTRWRFGDQTEDRLEVRLPVVVGQPVHDQEQLGPPLDVAQDVEEQVLGRVVPDLT